MPRKSSGSDGAPVAARTSVSMASALHAKLKVIAAEESERTGKKVSVADLVEAAVLKEWFADRNVEDVTTQAPASTADGESQRQMMLDEIANSQSAEFDALLGAALADPIPDVICALDGTVQGTYGPIQRRDLAYHLRNAIGAGRAICSLDELIVDYQG